MLIGRLGNGFEWDVKMLKNMYVLDLMVSVSVILILKSFFGQQSGKKVKIFEKTRK